MTTASSPTASTVSASATPNALAAPPDVTTPTPPAGFVPPDSREFFGFRAQTREVAAASTAVADLARFANYLGLLGSSAPAAATVASALTLALAWRTMRTSAEAWAAYVKSQDALAWKAALVLLEELKPLFLIAATKNPELATQYPGLSQMFNAPAWTARVALAARKRKAKAAATAAATALAEANAKAATPAVVPAKAVTVTV